MASILVSRQSAILARGHVRSVGLSWTTLGSLYTQAPGWPISFGEKMGLSYLKKGLEIASDDIDARPTYLS